MAKEKKDLEKVTVRLTKGTVERIRTLFPKTPSYNEPIRMILDYHLKALEEAANKSESEIDFNLTGEQ